MIIPLTEHILAAASDVFAITANNKETCMLQGTNSRLQTLIFAKTSILGHFLQMQRRKSPLQEKSPFIRLPTAKTSLTDEIQV